MAAAVLRVRQVSAVEGPTMTDLTPMPDDYGHKLWVCHEEGICDEYCPYCEDPDDD